MSMLWLSGFLLGLGLGLLIVVLIGILRVRHTRRAAIRAVVAWMRSNAYVTMADRVARAFDVDR